MYSLPRRSEKCSDGPGFATGLHIRSCRSFTRNKTPAPAVSDVVNRLHVPRPPSGPSFKSSTVDSMNAESSEPRQMPTFRYVLEKKHSYSPYSPYSPSINARSGSWSSRSMSLSSVSRGSSISICTARTSRTSVDINTSLPHKMDFYIHSLRSPQIHAPSSSSFKSLKPPRRHQSFLNIDSSQSLRPQKYRTDTYALRVALRPKKPTTRKSRPLSETRAEEFRDMRKIVDELYARAVRISDCISDRSHISK